MQSVIHTRKRKERIFAAVGLAVASVYTFTHNFNRKPSVSLRLKCITADAGYSVGNELEISSGADATSSGPIYAGVSVNHISNNAFEVITSNWGFTAHNRTAGSIGATVNLTAARWELIAEAKI